MKRFSTILLIVSVFTLLGLSSCGSFIALNVQMLEPGGVALRPDLNTVALVNRASTVSKKFNVANAVMRMETDNEESVARQQILQGLNSSLVNSPRLTAKLTDIELKGDGSGVMFPKPLGWDTVNAICNAQGVDALVVLETFESDANVTNATGNVQVNNEMGIPIPSVQFYATLKVTVKAGFRIYDPKNSIIIDQYSFSYWRKWNETANSLGEALALLTNRQTAIVQTSQEAGNYYKKRISPTWMNETRYLYKKSGNSPFATGSRLAIVGNWEEAAGYWKEVINSSPNRRKLCGKAAYNLAVAAEMKGDLEEARNWISKSYGIYNNKQAPYYQNTINRRYNAMLQLNQQMQEQK